MRPNTPRLAHRLKIACMLALSVSTVIGVDWVGAGLRGECLFERWLGSCGPGASLVLARTGVVIIVAGALLWLAYLCGKSLLLVRHLAQTRVMPHQVLIMPLSAFKPIPRRGEDGVWRVRMEDAQPPREVPLSGALSQDIAAFTRLGWTWNGQQFLRGIEPHITSGALEHIVLVGSSGSGQTTSYAELDAVREILGIYTRAKVHPHATAVDFENIKSLEQTFDHWIKHFTNLGVPEKAIIIDVTGGQKTTSIAGALATLHWQNVEFQYVQTNPSSEGASVVSFNVVIEAPPRHEGA